MKNILFVIAISILLISCEEIVDNPGLPYKEQLVIRALIEPGKPVAGIKITKTLPPLDNYDEAKALITDADAKIEYDGKEYKLSYDNLTQSYFNNELIPKIGGKYYLSVTRANLKASAETTIRDSVNIESFFIKFYKDSTYYGENIWNGELRVNFIPQLNTVYTGNYFGENNQSYFYQDFIYRINDTLKNGRLSFYIANQSFFNYSDTIEIKKSIKNDYCLIYSWDTPFYNYFITRYEGSSDDNIFGTSGINVKGNIVGGLGMFIGRTTTKKKVFFN